MVVKGVKGLEANNFRRMRTIFNLVLGYKSLLRVVGVDEEVVVEGEGIVGPREA